MMFSGRFDAKMNNKGRILLPACFRKQWNLRKVYATTELCKSGMYVACYHHLPNQEEYKNHRRARLERILTENHTPDIAHKTALVEITKDIHFAELTVDKRGSVLLRDLCMAARMENPLLWVSTGIPAFNNTYCIELWGAADFERAEAQFYQELGEELKRVYHVLP